MAKSCSRTLDKWRDYFLTAIDSNIFDIIEGAIKVAAVDCPKEFKSRRDGIAELLFSCKVTKCFGCDKVELAVPNDGGDESKVNGFGEFEVDADDHHGGSDEGLEINLDESNYSYREAEALTDAIEEQSQMFGEVLRIKEILENSEDQCESVLFDSLRRLQLMGLSVEILKATEIGKVVKCFRRHASNQIGQLAKTLVESWMVMVDEWMSATAAMANVTGCTPESLKTSDVVDEEEEGLPSPPLDEGAFFTTQPMELSQFFDGMDDDGNPQNSGEFNKNSESGRKPSLEKQNAPRRKQQIHDDLFAPPKEKMVEKPKKQETAVKQEKPVTKKPVPIVKPNKPSMVESVPGRPLKASSQQNAIKSQQKPEKGTIQKREIAPQQNKLKGSDEAAVLVKLEASKRKLQERYQEAQNAKRQRTIQVMELQDIPKQGLGNRNSHFKPGGNNHGRHWANGRR